MHSLLRLLGSTVRKIDFDGSSSLYERHFWGISTGGVPTIRVTSGRLIKLFTISLEKAESSVPDRLDVVRPL